MDLYLVRHGAAVERAAWSGPDSERPLTETGRKDMARVASSIAKLGLHIDAIVSSPYTRAHETADILAQHLNLRDKLAIDKTLAPGFSPESLGKVLKRLPDLEGVVLVGHEPDLSSTIGRLTGGKVAFKKGAVAQVRFSYPSFKKAELVWLAQPALIGL